MIPLASICIATYNQERFIARAIESVLEQDTDFPFEILIGEDESSDRTREICLQYQQEHPEIIKVVSGRRKDVIYVDGVATGRSNLLRLLSLASGKYVALCEGDDYWTSSHKLHRQISFLEVNPNYSGACHLTPCINELGQTIKVYGEGLPLDVTIEDVIDKWSPFHTSSLVFRKSRLPWPLPEWFNSVISADMALFMLVANEGPLRFFPSEMSVYRRHPASLTGTVEVQEKLHKQRLFMLNKFEEYLPEDYHPKIRQVAEFHKTQAERSTGWVSFIRQRLRSLLSAPKI